MSQLIVVDIETTGLDFDAALLEVAAINVTTGDELYFVPCVRIDISDTASEALSINRYFERGVFKNQLSPEDTTRHFSKLRDMLKGNTFAGSNPRFDASFISRVYYDNVKSLKMGEPWHHRLADLSAYAAGSLGLLPTELPGLAAVCKQLGVRNTCEHSALGDARATAECFQVLMRNPSVKYQKAPPIVFDAGQQIADQVDIEIISGRKHHH